MTVYVGGCIQSTGKQLSGTNVGTRGGQTLYRMLTGKQNRKMLTGREMRKMSKLSGFLYRGIRKLYEEDNLEDMKGNEENADEKNGKQRDDDSEGGGHAD